MTTTLRRMRLPLDRYNTVLLLVGDSFEEGGRYVQAEISGEKSAGWSWLDWDDAYDRLAKDWHRQFPSDRRGGVTDVEDPGVDTTKSTLRLVRRTPKPDGTPDWRDVDLPPNTAVLVEGHEFLIPAGQTRIVLSDGDYTIVRYGTSP